VSKYLKIIGNALVKISVSVVTDLRHIDDVIDICVSQDSVLLEFFVLYPQGDERMQLEALRTKEAIRQSMKGIVLERAHLAISAEAGWPSMTHLVAIPTQDTNKQVGATQNLFVVFVLLSPSVAYRIHQSVGEPRICSSKLLQFSFN
jgi:hypothetical protein